MPHFETITPAAIQRHDLQAANKAHAVRHPQEGAAELRWRHTRHQLIQGITRLKRQHDIFVAHLLGRGEDSQGGDVSFTLLHPGLTDSDQLETENFITPCIDVAFADTVERVALPMLEFTTDIDTISRATDDAPVIPCHHIGQLCETVGIVDDTEIMHKRL